MHMCRNWVGGKWMQTICLADVPIFHRLVFTLVSFKDGLLRVCASNFFSFSIYVRVNLRVSDDPPALWSVQCTFVTSALNK